MAASFRRDISQHLKRIRPIFSNNSLGLSCVR
jgi:hypothetical protein